MELFCSELTATISGLILGVFIDTITATPPGYNSILFLVLGLAVSLIGLAGIEILSILVGAVGSLVGLYATAGIVFSFLVHFKVFK